MTSSFPTAFEVAFLPSTVTREAVRCARSRSKLDRSCVAVAVMVAVPVSLVAVGS
jgi:hypothetical protein